MGSRATAVIQPDSAAGIIVGVIQDLAETGEQRMEVRGLLRLQIGEQGGHRPAPPAAQFLRDPCSIRGRAQ